MRFSTPVLYAMFGCFVWSVVFNLAFLVGMVNARRKARLEPDSQARKSKEQHSAHAELTRSNQQMAQKLEAKNAELRDLREQVTSLSARLVAQPDQQVSKLKRERSNGEKPHPPQSQQPQHSSSTSNSEIVEKLLYLEEGNAQLRQECFKQRALAEAYQVALEKRDVVRLEDIAADNPDVEVALVEVIKILNTPANTRFAHLLVNFPHQYDWDSLKYDQGKGRIHYPNEFVKGLRGCSDFERVALCDAINLLQKYGKNDPLSPAATLETKPYYEASDDAWVSKAKVGLRWCWQRNADVSLTMHHIFDRGDSKWRQQSV